MLGFDATGRLALGEVPESDASSIVYTPFSTAPFLKSGLAAAVIATTFVGFIPPIPARAAVFVKFSEPVRKVSPALSAQWISTPSRPVQVVTPFTQFSQPFNSRGLIADEMPSAFFEILPPQAPPFTGFSKFEGVIEAKFNVAPFSNFNFVPFIAPVDTHDGVFVKKKRKPTKRELEPYVEEAEIKQKRRQAIEEAIYGPPVEYTLPPLAFPPSPPAPPQLGDLPQIIMAAQQRKVIEDRLKQIQDEEDDLEKILREIL